VRANQVQITAFGAAIIAGVGANLIDMNDVGKYEMAMFSPTLSDNGE